MMSWSEWINQQAADREARTRRERHGLGVLTLLDGVPVSATGCLLPDGTVTDAECLLPHIEVDEARRVRVRRLPGTVIRRRGRLVVEPDVALRFVDERDADLADVGDRARTLPPNVERDLELSPRIRDLVRGDMFATLLYNALCNTVWRHVATGTLWHCSWRHAANVVAMLRCEGDYMDWYCSMGEGLVDEQVLAELTALGWELAEAELPEG
jgi:hypothetical protein